MANSFSIRDLKDNLLLKSEQKGKFNLFNFIFNSDNPDGVTLPYLLKMYLFHDGWRKQLTCKNTASYNIKKRYEKRLRQTIQRLKLAGIVSVVHGDEGLIWIRPTQRALNLIIHNTETCPLPRDTGNRSNPLQRFAANYCLGPKISPEQYKEIKKAFGKYQDSICSTHVIVNKMTGKLRPEVRSIPRWWGNRNVDIKEQERILQKFRKSWERAKSHYDKAFFLTVTLDRSNFNSVLDANRKFTTALHSLNKKISYVIKKQKPNSEVDRITVHEFQQDGYLHAHILFFGIDFLMHYRALSGLCRSCGLGTIVYVYSLKRDNSTGELSWAREKPRDIRDSETAQQYLFRYLVKSITNPQQFALYWVFHQRFFTTSRFLTIKDRRKARTPQTILRCCKSIQVEETVKKYEQKIASDLTNNLEFLKDPAIT